MELFYTVISQPCAAQSSPLNSLGGYCSTSKVQSGQFNSLFGDISSYSLKKNSPEYIALMLKNTTGSSVKNLKFWLEKDADSLCNIRIALASPNVNGEMEHISTINSKPLYAEFYSPDKENPLEIEGIFEPGMELGLWIERSIIEGSDQVSKVSDCNYLFQLFSEKKKLPTSEVQSLKISWEEI